MKGRRVAIVRSRIPAAVRSSVLHVATEGDYRRADRSRLKVIAIIPRAGCLGASKGGRSRSGRFVCDSEETARKQGNAGQRVSSPFRHEREGAIVRSRIAATSASSVLHVVPRRFRRPIVPAVKVATATCMLAHGDWRARAQCSGAQARNELTKKQ